MPVPRRQSIKVLSVLLSGFYLDQDSSARFLGCYGILLENLRLSAPSQFMTVSFVGTTTVEEVKHFLCSEWGNSVM